VSHGSEIIEDRRGARLEFAYDKNKEPTLGPSMSAGAWEALKSSYTVGDFTMPCCGASAILKTSPNGHHFFAHHSGECTTAPESVWHLNAKALIAHHLSDLGIECKPEMATEARKWIADIFFNYKGRDIAVELQHSYQSIADYRRRQQRYEGCGVECYWLLYPPRYHTVTMSMLKWRFRNEFGRKWPEGPLLPSSCPPDVPIALLEVEYQEPVRGQGLHVTVAEWLRSILDQRFRWSNFEWTVSEDLMFR
jgi:competence protein CoiA